MNRKQRFKIIAGSIIISCLILISITLCLISVFIKDFTHDKHLYSETANYELNDILLNVGSSTFYITSETPEGTIFELMEASVDSPLAISWNSNQQISVSINGKELDTDDEIKIEKISNYDLVDLNISYGNFNKQYFIRTLPEDFPKLKITGQTEYAGDFYGDLASSSQNEYFYIYKYSTSGVLKYFKASSVLIRNFRKWEIDGTSYYTYFEETPEYNNLSDGAYSQGQYIVMDSAYNIIDMVNILDSDSKNIVSEYTEQHEFTMLGLNHYILIAYVVRNPNIEHCNGTLSPGTRITAAYLQEIKNDEIIWDWISTDYPEFYTGYV